MGFLGRKKKFTPVRVKEVRALRPSVNMADDRYEAHMRIMLEDGQNLDLIMDVAQLKILSVNCFTIAKTFNIDVDNPIADHAATWWGMAGG